MHNATYFCRRNYFELLVGSVLWICLVTGISACSAQTNNAGTHISNYSECIAAGNKVLQSMPQRCVAPSGEVFTDTSIQVVPDRDAKRGCVNKCGDGSCAEIVCMALGCPCAENAQNCPQDCKP